MLVTTTIRDHAVVLWSGCRQRAFYELYNLPPSFSLYVKWEYYLSASKENGQISSVFIKHCRSDKLQTVNGKPS